MPQLVSETPGSLAAEHRVAVRFHPADMGQSIGAGLGLVVSIINKRRETTHSGSWVCVGVARMQVFNCECLAECETQNADS